MIYVVLIITAFVTSIISAILGMAGGVMLLAVMLTFLSHAETIPTHAVVQIASNGTRALALLGHLDGRAISRFIAGAIPGGAIGVLLLWKLGPPEESEPLLKALVGAYIIFATWMPRGSKSRVSSESRRDFLFMGLAAGAAALTVGAVGPLIAPIFSRRDYTKESLIATKAVCQLVTHFMKIPAFVLLRDLDISRLGILAVVMIVAVIPGTLIGRRLLGGFPEQHFRAAFRTALTLAGLKILLWDGLRHFV